MRVDSSPATEIDPDPLINASSTPDAITRASDGQEA